MNLKYANACHDILPEKLQHVFEAEILQLLPNRDQHGRRLLVLEVGSKFSITSQVLFDIIT